MNKANAFITLCILFFITVYAECRAEDAHYKKQYYLSYFGNAKYIENFKHFDFVNPNAPKGGTITYGIEGKFDNLNPYITKGITAAGSSLVYDTLMHQAEDEKYTQYGLIAESVELAEDGSSVIFNLRPEAKWHDGNSITSDDVMFSFYKLLNEGHPSFKMYFADIASVEKINDLKVEFKFHNKNNRELPLIAGQTPIISKKYYEHHEFNKTTLTPPLGNGSYKITKADMGRAITYERVKDYWGENLPVNVGRNNFDKIVYKYYRDDGVAVQALKSGDYDIRMENIAKHWKTSYRDRGGKLIKYMRQHKIPAGLQGFVFNLRREKFQDTKTRKAITYAFDFDWINEHLLYSLYKRNENYFPNSEYASRGIPQNGELEILEKHRTQLPSEIFDTEFKLPSTRNGKTLRDNLKTARKLLEEVGWKMSNGKLHRNGEKFTIEFLLHMPAMEKIITPFAQNLNKLGIEASIKLTDSSQYKRRIHDFDFDIIISSFPQSVIPSNEQILMWHSSFVNTIGGHNLAGINNPIIDEIVQRIPNINNDQELKNNMHALDRILSWQYYIIPQWHADSFRIVHWDKFRKPNKHSDYDIGIDTWWIKDD